MADQFLVIGTGEPVTEKVVRRTLFVMERSTMFESRAAVELANGVVGIEDITHSADLKFALWAEGHRHWFSVVRETYEELVQSLRYWEGSLITEEKPEWTRG